MGDIVSEMKSIDVDNDYFAATLLGTEDAWSLSFQSEFTGWSEDRGVLGAVELRKASLVDPLRMTALWEVLGQGWVAVSTRLHLSVFFRIGGNALIETGLAEEHLQDHIRSREVVKLGVLGYSSFDTHKRAVTSRRPTPAQRARVLERDGHRCQLCGERPSLNEHIVLHLHHIRPFGIGGLTSDENLITLCHTCHSSLEPHDKLSLFWIPGGQAERELEDMSPDSHQRKQATYQRMVSDLIPQDE